MSILTHGRWLMGNGGQATFLDRNTTFRTAARRALDATMTTRTGCPPAFYPEKKTTGWSTMRCGMGGGDLLAAALTLCRRRGMVRA